IGAFAGVAPAALRGRDRLPDVAVLFHVGTLIRQVRNADGLAAILEDFFGVPGGIEQFVAPWMVLSARGRLSLVRARCALGGDAVLGARIWDRQHKFRVHIGPLTLAQYESFLPGGAALDRLLDWVRFYQSMELDWDVRLTLARDEVPPLTLGRYGRLGW